MHFGKQVRGVRAPLDFLRDELPGDTAVAVDEEVGGDGDGPAAVSVFVKQAESRDDLDVAVGEQGEGQLLGVVDLPGLVDRIGGDA